MWWDGGVARVIRLTGLTHDGLNFLFDQLPPQPFDISVVRLDRVRRTRPLLRH